ncbi:electron transfer flavoprotein subunit beta/FixA family protein [candidate division KSB1 bacterium]|nr:electron transfer flavoprotein subunit beta/FixA family protein [candidate division KSB1 bacterium]
MKIVVCVKQVPDTETKIELKQNGVWIDDTNVNYVLNPYDEVAVEEALTIKEQSGGEVIILCLGPDRAGTAIRSALAMGADSGIHIKEDSFLMGLSVAKILAEKIKSINPDLVLLGKQAVDDDNMQIGPMLGELLDLPSISVVSKLEITPSNRSGTAERDIEGGKELIEFSIPAVITAQKGLNEPRYASLKGIMMAKKKPFEEVKALETQCGITISGISYPPKRNAGKILVDGAKSVPELVRLLREEAKVI